MTTSPRNGLHWCDHEVDFFSGATLRADVRATAQKIWPLAVAHSQRKLGDGWYAYDLLDDSISQISRYLDGKQIPVFGNDISRLLMRAFSFALKRKLGKCGRMELADDPESLDAFFESQDWRRAVHFRLDLPKYRSQMSGRSWYIFNLRTEHRLSWKKIGNLLGVSVESAKKSYYRELQQLRNQFMLPSSLPHG